MDLDEQIQKSCGNIRERLLACRSARIANALRDRLCSELRSNCDSEMVHNALMANVGQMIKEIFDQNGRNRYLEDPDEQK
ncbi:hypothetical protein JXA02_05695 [candidate division KSB1 bacterium]|nr:hypothetical protein [candidate division KSB1 bacterium]